MFIIYQYDKETCTIGVFLRNMTTTITICQGVISFTYIMELVISRMVTVTTGLRIQHCDTTTGSETPE